MNIALENTRFDATHIVTIDADYIADPEFVSKAASALHGTGADYVQFPQAYQRHGDLAHGADVEPEEYFRTDVRMADEADAVLLTGTLCVISKKALLAVGGWSGRTTAEDAELGVRLCMVGYRGQFIERVVGRGLLPFSLRDLSAHRYRWASRNLRALLQYMNELLHTTSRSRWRQRVALVARLSSWLNFSLIPRAVLLSALIHPFGSATRLAGIAALSVMINLADITIRLSVRCIAERMPADKLASACATRLALSPEFARATLDAFLRVALRFSVTNKHNSSKDERNALPMHHWILFLLVLPAAPMAIHSGALVAGGWLALTLPFPAALLTDAELARYRTHHSTSEVLS